MTVSRLIFLTIFHLTSGQLTVDPKVETLPCNASIFLDIGQDVAIETPHYPGQYRPKEKCTWKIKVPASSSLSIECQNFDLHSRDKFCIKDRNEKANNKCYKGSISWLEDPYEFPIHDSQSKFIILFKSKRRGQGFGFKCILSNNDEVGSTSEEPPLSTSAEPPTCECGEKNANHKIVGGQAAAPNEYPWQVGLVSRSGTLPFCGGSLISPTEVVTAAHCTVGVEADSIAVSLGEHNIFDTEADTVSVCQIIDHPAYNFPDFDFSILRLCEPVKYRSTVKPVCLPADVDQTYSGQVATVTGWGTLTSGISDRPDILMEVNVTVLSNQACAASYSSITGAMICAADLGKDSCQGDSGGPMVIPENERYALIGVVSWGIGCANPDYPGVYARVTAVMDWIIQNSSGAKDTNCKTIN